MVKKWAFVSDFDGTISKQDFYIVMMDKYFPEGRKLFQKWRAGGLKDIDFLSSIFQSINQDEEQIIKDILNIPIDEYVPDFIKRVQTSGADFYILSAGTDYYIKHILRKNNVDSSNCSLVVNKKKTTVPAQVPYGIIADLDIIQHAPNRFILAGIGDLMSNITALYDWEFEEKHEAARVNHFAYMLSKKAVNSFIRTPMTDIKAPIFLKELISSLTLGGISTVISGNSSPISGSEHLISHMLDKISARPQMHGIQVGVATYIMAKVQQHRAERIEKVFTRTGFFDYVKELDLKKDEFRYAIEMAPAIKPNRYTYLHNEEYRKKTLKFLDEDHLLNEVLK